MDTKTLIISVEAYSALKKLKKENLLEYIESTKFLEDLVESIENVYKSRKSIKPV